MKDANGDHIEPGDIVLVEATVVRDFGSAIEVELANGRTRAFLKSRNVTKKPSPPERDFSDEPLYMPAFA